jgi:hypothetical protein
MKQKIPLDLSNLRLHLRLFHSKDDDCMRILNVGKYLLVKTVRFSLESSTH